MNKKAISNEIIGGVTTFLAMSYIIIVNPQIIGSPGTGVVATAALTGTVALSALMTLLAGIFIKLPYALAPGMGLNILIVYSFVIAKKIPWNTAMGIVFLSGIAFFIISISPIRRIIIRAIPDNLKHGIICGIGVFLAYIGIKDLGFVKANPDTIIQIAPLNSSICLGILGFALSFYLFHKRKSYAFIASVIIVTAISFFLGKTSLPTHLFSRPDFSGFFHVDLKNAFGISFISVMLSILLTNIFDSTSTLMAVSRKGNFVTAAGEPYRLRQSLIVDSLASIFASLFGTTPGVIYLESSAGIEAGAQTGFASIVTALCFLPCLFIAPIIAIIPAYAIAPILIFVGILMTSSLRNIKLENFTDIIPIFFAVILMPLSSSITIGVFAGILSHLILKILVGEAKQVSSSLYAIGVCCLAVILLERYL